MTTISSGGGSTISTSKSQLRGMAMPRSLATLERVVRPFQNPDAVLQRIKDARPPEPEDAEAHIRWGGPSRFDLLDANAPTNPTFVVGGGQGGEEEEEEPPLYTFNEIQKKTEDHRVENPNNPDQYVIVQRRVWSVFQGDDGLMRLFIYDNSNLG